MFLKRNSLIALCVWLAILQGVQGCDPLPASFELNLEHEVSPQPPRVGPVTITLRLTDASGAPITGVVMELEGNMSHAGMAPVFAAAKETEAGVYRCTLELSMAGDWFVLVNGTWGENRKFGRKFEIKGVAPV